MKSISTLFGVVLGGLMLTITVTFASPASADTTSSPSPAPATCGAVGEIGKVVNGVCVLSKTARSGDIAVAPPLVPLHAKPRHRMASTLHHHVARHYRTTKVELPFTGPPPVGLMALTGSAMIGAGYLLLRTGRKHV